MLHLVHSSNIFNIIDEFRKKRVYVGSSCLSDQVCAFSFLFELVLLLLHLVPVKIVIRLDAVSSHALLY